jgi:hypothetical protein
MLLNHQLLLLDRSKLQHIDLLMLVGKFYSSNCMNNVSENWKDRVLVYKLEQEGIANQSTTTLSTCMLDGLR